MKGVAYSWLRNTCRIEPGSSAQSVKDCRLHNGEVRGAVRSQSSVDPPNGPKARYCANLGHVQDDESGLIYMRARYYEPWTGRFVSEDPGRHGSNWSVYADNNPVAKVDRSGRMGEAEEAQLWFFIGYLAAGTAVIFGSMSYFSAKDIVGAEALPAVVSGAAVIVAIYAFSRALGASHQEWVHYLAVGMGLVIAGFVATLSVSLNSLGIGARFAGGVGMAAATLSGSYIAAVMAALLWTYLINYASGVCLIHS